MTPIERAKKAMQVKSDSLAILNGRQHARTLEDQRYYAGYSEGLLAAIEILTETLKAADAEDD